MSFENLLEGAPEVTPAAVRQEPPLSSLGFGRGLGGKGDGGGKGNRGGWRGVGGKGAFSGGKGNGAKGGGGRFAGRGRGRGRGHEHSHPGENEVLVRLPLPPFPSPGMRILIRRFDEASTPAAGPFEVLANGDGTLAFRHMTFGGLLRLRPKNLRTADYLAGRNAPMAKFWATRTHTVATDAATPAGDSVELSIFGVASGLWLTMAADGTLGGTADTTSLACVVVAPEDALPLAGAPMDVLTPAKMGMPPSRTVAAVSGSATATAAAVAMMMTPVTTPVAATARAALEAATTRDSPAEPAEQVDEGAGATPAVKIPAVKMAAVDMAMATGADGQEEEAVEEEAVVDDDEDEDEDADEGEEGVEHGEAFWERELRSPPAPLELKMGKLHPLEACEPRPPLTPELRVGLGLGVGLGSGVCGTRASMHVQAQGQVQVNAHDMKKQTHGTWRARVLAYACVWAAI